MNDEDRHKIDYVLDEFDFEKVHRAMVALEWNWIGCEGVPHIAYLRRRARQLLMDVCKKGGILSCGGFCAMCDLRRVLSLKFIVAKSDSIYFNEED